MVRSIIHMGKLCKRLEKRLQLMGSPVKLFSHPLNCLAIRRVLKTETLKLAHLISRDVERFHNCH